MSAVGVTGSVGAGLVTVDIMCADVLKSGVVVCQMSIAIVNEDTSNCMSRVALSVHHLHVQIDGMNTIGPDSADVGKVGVTVDVSIKVKTDISKFVNINTGHVHSVLNLTARAAQNSSDLMNSLRVGRSCNPSDQSKYEVVAIGDKGIVPVKGVDVKYTIVLACLGAHVATDDIMVGQVLTTTPNGIGTDGKIATRNGVKIHNSGAADHKAYGIIAIKKTIHVQNGIAENGGVSVEMVTGKKAGPQTISIALNRIGHDCHHHVTNDMHLVGSIHDLVKDNTAAIANGQISACNIDHKAIMESGRPYTTPVLIMNDQIIVLDTAVTKVKPLAGVVAAAKHDTIANRNVAVGKVDININNAEHLCNLNIAVDYVIILGQIDRAHIGRPISIKYDMNNVLSVGVEPKAHEGDQIIILARPAKLLDGSIHCKIDSIESIGIIDIAISVLVNNGAAISIGSDGKHMAKEIKSLPGVALTSLQPISITKANQLNGLHMSSQPGQDVNKSLLENVDRQGAIAANVCNTTDTLKIGVARSITPGVTVASSVGVGVSSSRCRVRNLVAGRLLDSCSNALSWCAGNRNTDMLPFPS